MMSYRILTPFSVLVLAFIAPVLANSTCGAEGPLELLAGKSMQMNVICHPAGSKSLPIPISIIIKLCL